jgi:hypothetical protein
VAACLRYRHTIQLNIEHVDEWLAADCVAELVKALVRLGSSIDINNWMGQTARLVAQEAGHVQVAEFLEEREYHVLGQDLQSNFVDLKPRKQPPGEFRKSNWICPRCSASVYGSSKECYKCMAPRPSSIEADVEEPVGGVSAYGKHLLHQMREDQDANESF